MLSRRIANARPLAAVVKAIRPTTNVQRRCLSQAEIEDPNMVSSAHRVQ
jgi:hypothetical protein